MCGIVGLIRNPEDNTYKADLIKFFNCLLVVDQFRGEHSTGLIGVTKATPNPQHFYFKRAMNAMDFLNLRYVQGLVDNIKELQVLIGHNRFATYGSVNNTNAHPFSIDPITLVHNGTINNFGKYDNKSHIHPVDSGYLTYLFSEHPWLDVLKEVKGAYALVWYDMNEEKLNIIRNSERTLFFAEGKFGFALASEEWMLNAASEYSTLDIKEPIAFKPFHHYAVDMSKTDKLEVSITDYSNQLKPITPPSTAGYWNYTPATSSSVYYSKDAELCAVGKEKLQVKEGEFIEFLADGFERTQGYYNAAKAPPYGTLLGWCEAAPYEIGVTAGGIPEEFWNMIKEIDEPFALYGVFRRMHARNDHSDTTNHPERFPYVGLENITAEISLDDGSVMIVKATPYWKAKNSDDAVEIIIKGDDKQNEEPGTSLIVSAETEEADFQYGCPVEDGGFVEKTKKDWEEFAKFGCCFCSDPVLPDIYKDTVRIQEGNCLIDKQDHIWCDDCWINDSQMMRH